MMLMMMDEWPDEWMLEDIEIYIYTWGDAVRCSEIRACVLVGGGRIELT